MAALPSDGSIDGFRRYRVQRRDIHEIPPSEIPTDVAYQWIAKSILGDETESLTRYLLFTQNGWKPVPADRHQYLFPDAIDVIEIGGLVLSELPKEIWEQRRREGRERTNEQRTGHLGRGGTTAGNISQTITSEPFPGYNNSRVQRRRSGIVGRFHKIKHAIYLFVMGLTRDEYECACDGTLMHNFGPLIGRALGPYEYRRRKRIMKKEGRYRYGV